MSETESEGGGIGKPECGVTSGRLLRIIEFLSSTKAGTARHIDLGQQRVLQAQKTLQ
jgi:hypothetical protein